VSAELRRALEEPAVKEELATIAID